MIRSLIWDTLRAALPYRARRWVKEQKWFLPVSRRVFGNTVYSKTYFQDIERIEGASTQHVGQWIVDHLRPRRAIDVGCGPGLLLDALHTRGVQVFGVDISDASIERVTERGLRAERFDLTDPLAQLPGAPYDLVVSCEVAEHLEPQYADLFLDKLTAAGPVVYLTAAEPVPEQGVGLYHFNEQPNQYWIDRMRQRGWVYDEVLTHEARDYLKAHRVIDYLAKPMIFRVGR
jgi:SAM-dependent methyltransferase